VIGASELSDDDDGKNDGLKWKLAESSASGITFLPLVRYRHFVEADEAVLKYLCMIATYSVFQGEGRPRPPRHGLIG
jgi:hypothetical protein